MSEVNTSTFSLNTKYPFLSPPLSIWPLSRGMDNNSQRHWTSTNRNKAQTWSAFRITFLWDQQTFTIQMYTHNSDIVTWCVRIPNHIYRNGEENIPSRTVAKIRSDEQNHHHHPDLVASNTKPTATQRGQLSCSLQLCTAVWNLDAAQSQQTWNKHHEFTFYCVIRSFKVTKL